MYKHKVLIIVDAQNDFIDGTLANKEAQIAVPKIVDLIEENTWDMIVATQDTHYVNYLHTKEGEKLPIPHCINNTKGHEINQQIMFALNEAKEDGILVHYINKNTFGSKVLPNFISANIDFQLTDVIEITLCGFCTDICVVSNALNLKMEYANIADIYVKADCCAGVTPESHEAALTVMKNCQINIV